jgi:hypothetical protein
MLPIDRLSVLSVPTTSASHATGHVREQPRLNPRFQFNGAGAASSTGVLISQIGSGRKLSSPDVTLERAGYVPDQDVDVRPPFRVVLFRGGPALAPIMEAVSCQRLRAVLSLRS